jgi:flagellar basal-body rod protein FlgB
MRRFFAPLPPLKFSHTRIHLGETCRFQAARFATHIRLPNHHAEVTMLEQMTARLDFHSQSLLLRSQRQQVIASNIANADTPGFVARDFDFTAALQKATGSAATAALPAMTDAAHMRLGGPGVGGAVSMAYTVQTQPSQDGNSVDLDRERANFVDNSIRYESTLRFINGHVKTMLTAITGQ